MKTSSEKENAGKELALIIIGGGGGLGGLHHPRFDGMIPVTHVWAEPKKDFHTSSELKKLVEKYAEQTRFGKDNGMIKIFCSGKHHYRRMLEAGYSKGQLIIMPRWKTKKQILMNKILSFLWGFSLVVFIFYVFGMLIEAIIHEGFLLNPLDWDLGFVFADMCLSIIAGVFGALIVLLIQEDNLKD